MQTVVKPSLEESQYRCCCGSVNVRIGTLIIGAMELIGMVIQCIGIVARYVTDSDNIYNRSAKNNKEYMLASGIVAMLMTVFVVGFLFRAVAKEKRFLVIPHLVYQVLGIVALFVYSVKEIVDIARGATEQVDLDGEKLEEDMKIVYVVITVVTLVVVAVLEVWSFSVVFKFYRYLKDTATSTRYAVQC